MDPGNTTICRYWKLRVPPPWIILTVVIGAGDKQAKFGIDGVGIALRQGEGRRSTGARGIGRRQDLATTARDDVVGIGRTRTRGGTGNDFDFHVRAQPIPSKRVRDGLVFRYSGTGDIVDDGTGNVHLNHIEKIMALEHICPCVPTSPTSNDPKTGLHHCNTQSGPVCSSCGRYWK
jgi:hypothetical protein